ncbi:hypothetical protein BC829DRAFT_396798 [Chytridium lagenaria]|nr:hypothetical protein BC829DRAFT_396798 [Chytridium lagenaria]
MTDCEVEEAEVGDIGREEETSVIDTLAVLADDFARMDRDFAVDELTVFHVEEPDIYASAGGDNNTPTIEHAPLNPATNVVETPDDLPTVFARTLRKQLTWEFRKLDEGRDFKTLIKEIIVKRAVRRDSVLIPETVPNTLTYTRPMTYRNEILPHVIAMCRDDIHAQGADAIHDMPAAVDSLAEAMNDSIATVETSADITTMIERTTIAQIRNPEDVPLVLEETHKVSEISEAPPTQEGQIEIVDHSDDDFQTLTTILRTRKVMSDEEEEDDGFRRRSGRLRGLRRGRGRMLGDEERYFYGLEEEREREVAGWGIG